MKKTGFLHDDRYALHVTGSYHPEVSDRIRAVYHGIEEAGLLPRLTMIKACLPEMKWIEAIHEKDYIERFSNACSAGKPQFCCADNQMCCETYDIALLAVGGILETARMLMEGHIDNAFCAVRPPGHHAERDKAMGFCYFNNVAIAAHYLQAAWNIKRVAIIDFDVHHGNGTQHIFEQDPSVFYYSIHQHPSFSYPGTGRDFDQGMAEGFGFTKNSLVLPGQGDDEYRALMTRDLIPAMDRFKPEIVLVSTGFDAHEDDDMSDVKLTTECFSWIMHTIMGLAERHAAGRLISILEGGYALHRLPELAQHHVEILLNG